MKNHGKIALIDCTLVEDCPPAEGQTEEDPNYPFDFASHPFTAPAGSSQAHPLAQGSILSIHESFLPSSGRSGSVQSTASSTLSHLGGLGATGGHDKALEFRLVLEPRFGGSGGTIIVLMASTMQEKAAWCSDICQCIENLHYNDLLSCSMGETSAVALPQFMRVDPRLYCDSEDIKFSRTMTSCKVPQCLINSSGDDLISSIINWREAAKHSIRHASAEKLFDRLIDLRFLSIDFLNTFLLTYRVYTDGHTILEALKRVFYNPECGLAELIEQYGAASIFIGNSFDTEDGSLSPPPGDGSTHQQRLASSAGSHSLSEAFSAVRQHGKNSLTMPVDNKQKRRVSIGCVVQLDDERVKETNRRTSAGTERNSLGSTLEEQIIRKAAIKKGKRSDQNTEELPPFPSGGSSTIPASHFTSTLTPPSYGGDSLSPMSPVGLSVPRSRLAPIASCETLSESLDIPSEGDECLEFQGKTSAVDVTADSTSEESSKSDVSPVVDKPGTGTPVTGSKVNGCAKPQIKSDSVDSDKIVVCEDAENQTPDQKFTLQQVELVYDESHLEQQINQHQEQQMQQLKLGPVQMFDRSPRVRDEYMDMTLPLDPLSRSSPDSRPLIYRRRASANSDGRGSQAGQFDDIISSVPGTTSSTPIKYLSLIQTSSSRDLAGSFSSADTLVPSVPRSTPCSPCSSPKFNTNRLRVSGWKASSNLASPTHSGREIWRTNGRTDLENLGRTSRDPASVAATVKATAVAAGTAGSPRYMRRSPSPCASTSQGPRGSTGSADPSWIGQFVLGESLNGVNRSPTASPTICGTAGTVTTTPSTPANSAGVKIKKSAAKRGSAESEQILRTPRTSCTPRSSCATSSDNLQLSAKAGAVVTSSRASKRRSSSAAAAAAFAAATAGSTNLKEETLSSTRYYASGDVKSPTSAQRKRESIIANVAHNRVLNVLKHWIVKHYQDFESNTELKAEVKDLLQEMAFSSTVVASEQRLAIALLQAIQKQEDTYKQSVNLDNLLAPPPPNYNKRDTFENLSALDIAEQMTYLDYQIFASIRGEEFLSQAWMKADKATKAPHVLLVSKRFNEASRLVVSEIMRRSNPTDRASCIEKWAAIADICRCFKNYNGVLQICAAFVNSSIYRLKKTWEKISKQTKQMIEKLQTLVSSDGRFKNMRDALHSNDPPCIPYLGMYLTDLSFIEEGTPNTTEEGLINFSKMRMIAHVIREIQFYQGTPYKIESRRRVTQYLLDTSQLLEEEDTYRYSLEMEPRTSRTSIGQLGQTSA